MTGGAAIRRDAFERSGSEGILASPGTSAEGRRERLGCLTPAALELALEHGVASALAACARSEAEWDGLRDETWRVSRAGWQVLVPLRRNSVIVDLGAGCGATTRSLARNCREVISIDTSLTRLLVQRRVIRESRIENVTLVLGGPDALDRIRDASVDGVVLRAHRARRRRGGVRAGLLRRAFRILRRDGWCYLESRRRGGVERLGRAFPETPSHASEWLAIPGHDRCRWLRPAGDPGAIGELLRARGIAGRRMRLLGGPLSGILPRDLGTVLWRAEAQAPPWLVDRGERIAPERVALNATRSSLWYRPSEDAGRRMRDVALDDRAVQDLSRLARIARAVEGASGPAFFSDWRLETHDSFVWVDRALVPGVPLAQPADAGYGRSCLAVSDLLRRLQSFVPRIASPPSDLREVLSAFLRHNAQTSPEPDLASRLERVARCLEARRVHRGLFWMHGDVTPNNVLREGNRTELIDWDLTSIVDFPGYDMLNYCYYGECGPRPSSSFWAALLREAVAGRVDAAARELLERAYGPLDAAAAIQDFWVLRMARGIGFGPRWVDLHLSPALEEAERVLALR